MRTESFTIEQSLPRARLDTFLHQRFPCVSRNTLQRLIREGAIRVNGATVKPTHHPVAGEEVVICWPDPKPPTVVARDIPLDVVYEDGHLLVVHKPAGMVVHPAAGTEENTLVNALLHHCRGSLSGIGGVERPGIVHRLDQFTSGLLVEAKDDITHAALSRQFSRREVTKVYDALICGVIAPADGEIDAAIMRHPNHRKVMTVREGGRSARTSYRTRENLGVATWVEARLHTGRTHQIRVHFKHLGFPLVGDEVYGKRANARLRELTGWTVPRQMLHARRLGFIHPATGEPLEFEAPWPDDFRETLRVLRQAAKTAPDPKETIS